MSNTAIADRGIRAVLLSGVCLLSLTSVPAVAQSTVSQGTETVVVTGILGSLQRNLDIKRDAPGLVDAISAEDIGKFPDSDLAAAMQRIPGVTISRGVSSLPGTGSTTSTGDATAITVRGFGPTYNETLYDGRQVSTAIGNRGFDFSAVSADFVGEIDILKSPDATLSAGAIGATVNVKYPKPFDHPGLRIVGSASARMNDSEGIPTPNGDFLISDTFANDTFGVLLDAAYSDSRTRNNHINIQGWEGTQFSPSQFANAAATASTAKTVNGWFIQDYGIYQEHTHEMRQNARLVLQWRPVDNLEVTLNDNYGRDDVHQNQYGFSVWFNSGSLQNVVQNSNGTLISFNQPGTPTDFQGQFNGSVIQNNDVGLNVKYALDDRWTLTFDADMAESWLNPGGQLSSIDADVGYGPSQPGGNFGTNLGIAGVGAGQLPYPTSFGPSGNAANFLGSGIIGSHVLPMSSSQNYDAVNQFKAEAAWTGDHLQVHAGVQWMSDHFNLQSYDDFANNDWQAFSGYGTASNNFYTVGSANCPATANGGKPCPAGATLPQGLFTQSYGTANFINGFGNSSSLPARVLQFNPYPVLSYLQSLGNPQSQFVAGANTTCCTPNYDGTYRIILQPSSFRQIYEDTGSAYLSVSDEADLAGMPLKINLGVREEETSVRSTGLGRDPTGFTIQASDHTAYNVAFGPNIAHTGTNRYQHFLPNLDLNLQVADDMQVRLDLSRTLTKPPLGNLSPVQSLGATRTNSVTASAGNPELEPFLSDNIDLGWEWYYAPNSYVSVDGFNKDVTNFIVNGATAKTFNLVDPDPAKPAGTLIGYTLTTPVNGPEAKVDGVEIAWQHVFSESGFGFQANATIVGTNKPYDPTNLSISGFAIAGIGNSANFVAFYDKSGFQARVAVNWRASYLDHFGQIQNGSAFGIEPTFVNSATQVDFSTSYDLTENINLYLAALNLNDETLSTRGRFQEQLLDANDYGRSFVVGVHLKY